MNFKQVRVKIVILFILGCLSNKLFAQVEFKETSLSVAQSKITTAKSPYLIYFSGVWCPSCQLMEETTFTDEKLADQIQENYLAYKVDIDSKEGKNWMQEYAVTCLPTTLFYSAEGVLLERLEKPITSTELLAMTAEETFTNSSLIAKNSGNRQEESNANSEPSTSSKTLSTTELATNSETNAKDNLANKTSNNPQNSGTANEMNKGANSAPPSYSSTTKEEALAIEGGVDSGDFSKVNNSPSANQKNANYIENTIENLENENERNSSLEGAGLETSDKYANNQNNNTPSFDKYNNNSTVADNTSNSNSTSESKDSKDSESSNLIATSNKNEPSGVTNNGGSNIQMAADYNAVIGDLNAEIKELIALSQTIKNTNSGDKVNVSKGSFSGSSVDENMANLEPNNSETFLSPSSDNLLAQISACKSLLTDSESLDKLISILENYRNLLTETKEIQMQLAKHAVPSEYNPTAYSAPKKSAKTKQSKNLDLFGRNQQIINYLNLKSPVKNGNQYIVQIGKYKNVRNAERLVQVIQNKYDYPIKVLIENKNNEPIQIVYLGEFKTQKEAIAANANLKWIKRKGIVKKF